MKPSNKRDLNENMVPDVVLNEVSVRKAEVNGLLNHSLRYERGHVSIYASLPRKTARSRKLRIIALLLKIGKLLWRVPQ